jgi:hypothetical protein
VTRAREKKRPNALVAHVQARPQEHAEDDWEEERLAHAHMGRGGPAEVPCEEDCAQDGGPRDDVQDRAGEQREAEGDQAGRLVAYAGRSFRARREAEHLAGPVDEEEEDEERANNARRPGLGGRGAGGG